ncbi:MAG: S1 family peptidase [Alphaproteobacteria bacterium]
MEHPHAPYVEAGATALVHLTGPCRGRVTWLKGDVVDIALDEGHFPHAAEARADEAADNVVAHLHRVGETYEIASPPGRSVWVNGAPVQTRELQNRDLVEFGEHGPLSRFYIYPEDRPTHKPASDILGEGLVYLRASRQPFGKRLARATTGLFARLTSETTLLFRIGVVISIAALAAMTYQQSRLNMLLQEQIASETNRIEDFAAALVRARDEALTHGDLTALQQEFGTQITSTGERLQALERRSHASARVIAGSMASVVFIQGAYGFRERATGRLLRHALDDNGNPLLSPRGQPRLSLTGDGQIAERIFSGTGFAVGDGRTLVTNRHVALPWEDDANVGEMAKQDLEPVMLKYIAYAPGNDTAGSLKLLRASEDADLAILRLDDKAALIPALPLGEGAPQPGDEIIVMGYPTGLRSMLAQSGREFIAELQESGDADFWSVAARLAKKGRIAPLASRGIVGQVTSATIVYDAETTHGGSGGPVLGVYGAVVAVNAAILPEYGGSNLGVPVAKVRALLEAAELM